MYVSAVAFYESVLGLARARNMPISGARAVTQRLLMELRAETVSIDNRLGNRALDAFERFGKGRHRAALNLGDCFAYACARTLDVPLLCKGDDFPHTDIPLA